MNSVPKATAGSEPRASTPAVISAPTATSAAAGPVASNKDYSIVVAAHGSRDPAGVREVEALVALMRKRAPARSITLGFLEFALPTIDEGVRAAVAAGAERVVMLPALLL